MTYRTRSKKYEKLNITWRTATWVVWEKENKNKFRDKQGRTVTWVGWELGYVDNDQKWKKKEERKKKEN